jgi:hypothetical protein
MSRNALYPVISALGLVGKTEMYNLQHDQRR